MTFPVIFMCIWIFTSVDMVDTRYPYDYSQYLKYGGTNVCYTDRCKSGGVWNWFRCQTSGWFGGRYVLYCCKGWQNLKYETACSHAICNGKISAKGDRACNKRYENDYIKYRNKTEVKNSGGNCIEPETCSECNDGFYASGAECLICPEISNCYHRKCTTPSDNVCKYCKGEVKDKRYWRAFVIRDGEIPCQKVCSWRSDSNRCYPGNCSDEIVTSCICMKGFKGHHCEQMTEKPNISYNLIKLELGNQIVANPENPNVYKHPMPIVWTKKIEMTVAKIFLEGKYVTDTPSPIPSRNGTSHFITDWKTGITGGAVYLRLYRAGSKISEIEKFNCPGTWEDPKPVNYTCEATLHLYDLHEFIMHDDILEIELSVSNGGFVEVLDRENDKRNKYKYEGKDETRFFRYHFDTVAPYQKCVKSGSSGCTQPVTSPDITSDATVVFSWNDWVDDLSQLKGYSYEVYDMKFDRNQLWEDRVIIRNDSIDLSDYSTTFVLDIPGMYSIIFAANDNAGNNKLARKLVLFDDKSKVTKIGKRSYVTTASSNTSNTWVVKDTKTVTFEFKGRFCNIQHQKNHWLDSVRKYLIVDDSYDDKYGKRNINKIDNTCGIVDFKVSFQVYSSNTTEKDSRLLTSISNIHDQSDTVTVDWEDGDKLKLIVRAIDVFDVFDEEAVTVYRDATPPVIEDLWLTKGKRNNIYVHKIEEFTEMTIEWDAYDYHSGIDSLYWKLYDNFTETVILHGHEDLIAQGNTEAYLCNVEHSQNLTACQAEYGGEPGHCYCTPFVGCFHKHFTVKPKIKDKAGLIPEKDRGIHDYDYYIEVQVTNIAQLISTHMKKITIDVSPPHTGVVHDGVKGTLEVDYQQSKILNAHWEGFFDRESGVLLYVYTFKTSCQEARVMVLDSGDPMIVETDSSYATYTVTTKGKYYITVVAFNRALKPSIPVCSDGVTVDTSTPSVKEVTLKNAIIYGGLVTDTGKSNVWVLGSDRVRRQVDNVTAQCWNKATVITGVEMYPVARDKKGSATLVDGYAFCKNTSSAPSVIKNMIPKSSMMYMEWLPVDGPGGIFDYEVGVSKTALGSAAPDILGFISTKQHAHTSIRHVNLPDGTEFYFQLKTISKSEVEMIQTLGPCIMDTSAPDHTGQISVSLSGDYVVASWSTGDFLDTEDYFGLTYYFAIGHEKFGTDVQNYEKIRSGGICVLTTPPTCTAAKLSDLDWQLHGHHTYYITVKAENTVGLFVFATSQPYVHDEQLASKGVVLDVAVGRMSNDTAIPYLDDEETDFQTDTHKLAARWSGFVHPHLDVSYRVYIGTTRRGSDIMSPIFVDKAKFFEKSGLNLHVLQTYYFTVEAVTSVGNVSVTSDGVTVVQKSYILSNISIFDGKPCNMTVDNGKLFKHHEEDNRVRCVQDIDYQASLNTIQAYWTIPDDMRYYTPDTHWAVEIRSEVGRKRVWTVVQDYQYISSSFEAEAHSFTLLPGRTYRSAIKICARETCYAPLYTDGVTILSNPPQKGSMILTHRNTTETGGKEKLTVNMSRFFDPDVISLSERYDAIEKYEWTVTDNSESGKIFTKWRNVNEAQITVSGADMTFKIELNGTMDFSRCKRFSVRGYNKAKLWTVITADIKSCVAFDPLLIVPNVVIDSYGDPEYDTDGSLKNGYGKQIFLPLNENWKKQDVDYTPYINYISAVWPKLRHHNYKHAVLKADAMDVTTYNLPFNKLSLRDPCSHPNALSGSCGTTEKEYVNVKFIPGDLVHGNRYIVCIHAPETKIHQETWIETLPEINACSDGVVVDLSPPKAGDVWIGHIPGYFYQTTTTHMYVNWESFIDVEEFRTNSHESGIKSYIISIGTSPGGKDIVASRDVGVINHAAFHNLQLQRGHTYYATVTAEDFAGRTTKRTSPPIVVDTTPPLKTNNPIRIPGRHISSKTEVSACWSNVFMDPESGIGYYIWSVGSRPGYDDVMFYVNVSNMDCAVSDPSSPLDLHEGHAYYINVRAYNGAGIYSQASSWAYLVDLSPPVAGHIYDGKQNLNPVHKRDSDFQTDTSFVAAFWEGFYEAHSTIKEYRVSVGTCKQCENILRDQAIGIAEEFILPTKHVSVGLTYYTTVTACNTADLCTTVTSDGIILDNSPPTPGVVQDGTEETDTHYQAERTYIGAKWFGFTDPQSGLDRYEWWAGTSPGSTDVMGKMKLHLAEVATNPSIVALPLKKTIYVTVRAYNKAGLHSESTSNGFTLDTTTPLVAPPVLSREVGSIAPDSVVYRTSFKVSWTAEDEQSSIQRQYVSIKAHRGGEFQLTSTKVSGIVRDYMFSALDLNDGVNYYVNLISCNGAGLCSHAESEAILVDSSPPSRGMFAINTNHAANISRDVPDFMTWTKRAVYLAWIGFDDLHSNIDHYMVSIGTSFMASDLNKKTKSAVKISHSTKGHVYDEGHVQTAKIDTENLMKLTDGLYISMWAVNSVGLASPLIHSKFKNIPGGSLELMRRCEAYSCKGHCVCAPQDQACPTATVCNDKTGDATQSQLHVLDITDLRTVKHRDKSFTSTDVCLSGAWDISLYGDLPPKWYEWSVGFEEAILPEGVFHQSDERVWHDAGQNNLIVFTLPRGKSMLDSVKYSFFVRVWYTSDTYAVFKSNGITVNRGTAKATSVRKVTEFNLDAVNKNDMDYIKYYPFAISWKYVFLDAENKIDTFKLYLSSHPGGHDVYKFAKEFKAIDGITSYKLMRFGMKPHIKFYSNVVAYSNTGTHYTESSDGFIIDNSNPRSGLVYDGSGLHDIEYQSSINTVSASWHGFVDLDSGVKSYYWCVGLTDAESECAVKSWEKVGLRTSAESNLTASMLHGSSFYNKVYAIDNVGYASDTIVSDGVKIDTTPPIPQEMTHEETNFVKNPSFENSGGKEVSWNDIFSVDVCSLDMTYYPLNWERMSKTCLAVVTSNTNLAKAGRTMVIIRGSLKQNLKGLEKGGFYRVTFVTSHLPTEGSVLANKEGFVKFCGEKYVFLLYTKSYRLDEQGNESRKIISWHSHTFYFHASTSAEELIVGSLDMKTGMLLDDIQVHKVILNTTGEQSVHSHVVFLHEWGSIHGSWSFIEDESYIVDYKWGIGYTRGGTQIQEFKSAGLRKFAYNSGVTLTHKSNIFVTVLATNSAGLMGVANSPPILVDLTEPDITVVNDGIDLDLDSWEQDEVLVNWKVVDPESGIKYCEWAIGTQPLGNEIQTFTKIEDAANSGILKDVGYSNVEGKTIYNTIRCHNKAGLHSVKTSDGVKISKKSPDVSSVDFVTIGLSSTQYKVKSGFQSITDQVRLMWTGFTDFIGMEGYVFTIRGAGTPYFWRKMLSDDQTYTFVRMDKLSMTEGMQEMSVKAVNLQLKSSQDVHRNFTILLQKPMIVASKNLDVTWNNDKKSLTVSWNNVFSSGHSLYYEVSAGTVVGGADILKWMETTLTSVIFGLPSTVRDLANGKLFIVVRAISVSGLSITKSGSITLPSNA